MSSAVAASWQQARLFHPYHRPQKYYAHGSKHSTGKIHRAITRIGGLSSHGRNILHYILGCQNKDTGQITITNDTLTKVIGRSPQTVSREISKLKDLLGPCIEIDLYKWIPPQTRRLIYVRWNILIEFVKLYGDPTDSEADLRDKIRRRYPAIRHNPKKLIQWMKKELSTEEYKKIESGTASNSEFIEIQRKFERTKMKHCMSSMTYKVSPLSYNSISTYSLKTSSPSSEEFLKEGYICRNENFLKGGRINVMILKDLKVSKITREQFYEQFATDEYGNYLSLIRSFSKECTALCIDKLKDLKHKQRQELEVERKKMLQPIAHSQDKMGSILDKCQQMASDLRNRFGIEEELPDGWDNEINQKYDYLETKMREDIANRLFARMNPLQQQAMAIEAEWGIVYVDPDISQEDKSDAFDKEILLNANEARAKQSRRPSWSKPPELTEEELEKIERSKRVKEILSQITPEWLERRDISWEELEWRLENNDDYDPLERDEIWDDDCHPRYALMSTEERDGRFRREMEAWIPKPFKYSKKWKRVLRKARIMADENYAKYFDWVAAQYDRQGWTLKYTHLNSRWAGEIYQKWLGNGAIVPESRGITWLETYKLEKYGKVVEGVNPDLPTDKEFMKGLPEYQEAAARVFREHMKGD